MNQEESGDLCCENCQAGLHPFPYSLYGNEGDALSLCDPLRRYEGHTGAELKMVYGFGQVHLSGTGCPASRRHRSRQVILL